MSKLIENIENDEYQNDKVREMPSRNHSFTQARIISLLSNDEIFTTFVELSLDVSQTDLTQFGLKIKEEIISDVCIYPTRADDVGTPLLV